MKRVFFLLAIAVFGTFSLQAQTGQGSIILGGTAGFSSEKTGDSKFTSVNISPSVRYFVIDRLAIGADLFVSAFKFGDSKSSTFGIGPSARYYLTADRPAAFFAQAGFSFLRVNYDSDFIDDTNSTGINFGLGGDFFLNDHVALEAVLGYSSEKGKDANDRSNTIGLQLGVVAFLWDGGDK